MGNSATKKTVDDNDRDEEKRPRRDDRVRSISFASDFSGDERLMGPILRRKKVSQSKFYLSVWRSILEKLTSFIFVNIHLTSDI